MNKKQRKAFKRAVLKGAQWLGKHSTKRGIVEMGINGPYEITKGETFIEIRDKICVYRFKR